MNCLSNGKRKGKSGLITRIGFALWMIVCVCLTIVGCTNSSVGSHRTGFKIHFLSVGQADAALIECDGHYAMIDCGNDSVVENGFKSYSIDMYLQQENIDSFDYIFCSHYDQDHYDGFADILENREFKSVYGPSGSETVDTHSMNRFRNLLHSQDKKIMVPKEGDKPFELGKAKIKVLAVDKGSSKNDSSLVLMVTYKKNRFLFMGDAEKQTEREIMEDNIDITCDVIKVAHHGSSTSSSLEFLLKAKPKYAIMSVAAGRNLPEGGVIDNFESVNSRIFRTDEEGTIICKSDGKRISITNADGEQLN